MSNLSCLPSSLLARFCEETVCSGSALPKIFAAEVLHRMIDSSLAGACTVGPNCELSARVIAMAFNAICDSENCLMCREEILTELCHLYTPSDDRDYPDDDDYEM